MERVIQALERARSSTAIRPEQRNEPRLVPLPQRTAVLATKAGAPGDSIREVELTPGHLEANRIIAHDAADPRSKSFDMLRTQVLQAMAADGWRVLAITSPTAGCGKTFTAINLALSIARQPESPATLVDMDLQKPQVAQRLGVECPVGIRAVLQGKTETAKALFRACIEGCRIDVLPAERPSSRSSDWIGSHSTASLLEELKADHERKVIILDLPPILAGDDVISILPQVDCVLLVAATGTTTTVELKECSKYLKSTPLVRIVLNKVPEPALSYY